MARHSRRRRRGGPEEHENEERWLLTYADMITLLMALFIIMWASSTVNAGKFDAIARSLQEAFSGRILPGGEAVVQPGAQTRAERAAPEPPFPAFAPTTQGGAEGAAAALVARLAPQREEEELAELKRRIDEYVATHGLRDQVQATVARRGLVVRVLTDRVLFESGSADIKPQADGLLRALARLLKAAVRNPIQVEGNTDNVPVRGGRFPTNWELSTARSTAVVRELIARGVGPGRLSATGYADRRPIASNETGAGRRRNRRVELVLLRTQGGTYNR